MTPSCWAEILTNFSYLQRHWKSEAARLPATSEVLDLY